METGIDAAEVDQIVREYRDYLDDEVCLHEENEPS